MKQSLQVRENYYLCKNLQNYYKILKSTICIILSAFLSVFAYAADGLRLSTVVIDPGHGGHDPGAVSADKKTYEKTITLDISKRLAARIQESYPEVKVVLTRTTDEFISLADRADKANKVDANLFISIHINAARSTSPNGYSLHLMGQSSNKNKDLFAYNMDVCKMENSVISFEEDATVYEGLDPDDPESQIFAVLMQSAYLEQGLKFAEIAKKHLAGGPLKADRGIWQDPFYVLWKTAMPAVLVELGFISNSTDLSQLKKADGRDRLAECLFEAFKEYKYSYDGGVAVEKPAESVEKPAESVGKPAESARKPETEVKSETEVKAGTGENADRNLFPGSGTDRSGSVTETVADGGVQYGVQIFAVGKVFPSNAREFLGYTPTVIKAGKVNKYIIGVSNSLPTAKKNFSSIKKKYPEAFLVKISDGRTELL